MRRGAFFAGWAASAATVAGGIRADAAETALHALRYGTSPDAGTSSVMWQAPNDIFAQNGLKLDGQRFNSGSTIAAAVIGGALDIGESSVVGLISAHVKGVPFVLESVQATYAASTPNNAFVVAKNSPIAAPAQLNGTTLSVPALGDLFALGISAWVDQNGGNSKTLSFVEIPIQAAATAIAAGRVTGAVLSSPLLEDAVDRGLVRILGHPYNAVAPRFGVTFYFCTRDFAAANVDVLARFRTAMEQQSRWAATHKSAVYALVARVSGAGPEAVQRLPWDVEYGVDLRLIQPVIDLAARYNVIPHSFPASDMIDPKALP
ncbi:MAG: ABC transporter substrate-binding protein [Candidatus Lustribacter sp.]